MIFAGVAIMPDAAEAVVARFRAITGLRGELKGSRITSTERGLLFEILWQQDARAWVAVADREHLARVHENGDSDLSLYARLLDCAVSGWMPASGGACADVIIDEGRYDPRILERVRGDVQALLGGWGKASLTDSRRSAGVQIADVVANSVYNMTIRSTRAGRISNILAPWTESGRINSLPLSDA
jgi:hypothetical protein